MPLKEKNLTPKQHAERANFDAAVNLSEIFWDDVGISKLFVQDHSESIKFSREQKKWLVWTGTHWETDLTESVTRKAIEFSQSLYGKVNAYIKSNDEFAAAQRQIKRSNSNTGLRSFLELSKAYLSVTNNQLDQNPYLLNCKNGTIDLITGEISAHDPKNLITKIVPYDYDETALCPEFDKFLAKIQPLEESRKFIQHSIGYSLLGVARERVFWILYGHGNNGKSVFIDLFSEILSDYASATTSSSVMSSKNDRIPNDIARLVGKRFVVIPETEENERLNAALIKSLSSGDKITARFLFGEFFDFYFSGKLWIATNHKPTITDHSKGFWDRLKIIPFTVDIPKEDVIKRDVLLASLLSEASGILAWAVRGVREYFSANALTVPKSIQDEISAYQYEQDSIAQFIDDMCVIGDDHEADNGEIYEKYKKFCNDNGEFQFSRKKLTQKLKERGFRQENSGRRYWKGLMLKETSLRF